MDLHTLPLDAATLLAGYRTRAFTPSAIVEEVYRRIAARGEDGVWLHLQPKAAVLQRAAALEARGPEGLSLFGLPCGIKDNIDVAGQPTSAGCEPFRYVPQRSATVVEKLERAGALLLGKQNLDQFATGLVGIRCTGPFCRNAIDPRYVPGGSSSGSAVAVAAGLTTFSIGSDTGGSGRVPAAYNGIVGLKPTPGLVSTRGFVHCNRSFDVPSVFARNIDDAYAVLECLAGHDPEDAFSEAAPAARPETSLQRGFRFAVPRAAQLELFGDALTGRMFARVLQKLQQLGGEPVEIDFAPFLEAGRLVFQSALIAERWLSYGPTIERHPDAIHPAVRQAISQARQYSASDAWQVSYRLRALQLTTRAALRELCLVTPTIGTLYTIDQVEADPFELNTRMGYYTYFANPLRMSAVSVPFETRPDGLPFGVSLAADSFNEPKLRALASALA